MRKKEEYVVFFDPKTGDFRFVADEYRHIPLRHGHVEAPPLPFATQEEREMFSMLYPGVDVVKLEEAIGVWNNFKGELFLSIYSSSRLNIENRKSLLANLNFAIEPKVI